MKKLSAICKLGNTTRDMEKEDHPIKTDTNTGNPKYKDVQIDADRLRSYGLIFLLWGWTNSIRILFDYIIKHNYVSIQLRQILEIGGVLIVIICLVYTSYFLWKQKGQPLSYAGLLLRYIWVSLILVMMLINLILNNELNTVNYDLQHPIFMAIIAMSVVLSGAILRNRILISGGVFFAICAFLSSYVDLIDQRVLEGIGWIVAFVLPGHLMYSSGKNQ